MKSKANIDGHSLHQILVAFPVVLFLSTTCLDLAFFYTQEDKWASVGYYFHIGAIISAILAAIPGILDYLYTIPPESSAKQRGRNHGILNVTALAFFIYAFILKSPDLWETDLAGLVCELAAVIILIFSGWLGGTLVAKNHIGIPKRYAHGGKLKVVEIPYKTGEKKIKVAKKEELKPDQMKLILYKHKRIVLGRTEKGYVAFEDYCTHKGASLADGVLICGKVQCPWHGSQFDVITGDAVAGPAISPIDIYKIEESNEGIYIIF